MSFDWGVIKPLVAGATPTAPTVSLMHVVLLPGQGHERHNHPECGRDPLHPRRHGRADGRRRRHLPGGPGPGGLHPQGRLPLDGQHRLGAAVLLAIYAPAGAEEALKGLPDYREWGRARRSGSCAVESERRAA